jgi:uncharacterized protein
LVSIDLKKERLIILDANFIFLPAQFQIDYLYEIESQLGTSSRFIVYQQILDELEAKRKRIQNSTKFRKNLNLGKRYLDLNQEKYHIEFRDEVKASQETTDDFLIQKCIELKESDNKVYLATNDGELRKRAKKEGVYIIFLRQKSYLTIERY